MADPIQPIKPVKPVLGPSTPAKTTPATGGAANDKNAQPELAQPKPGEKLFAIATDKDPTGLTKVFARDEAHAQQLFKQAGGVGNVTQAALAQEDINRMVEMLESNGIEEGVDYYVGDTICTDDAKLAEDIADIINQEWWSQGKAKPEQRDKEYLITLTSEEVAASNTAVSKIKKSLNICKEILRSGSATDSQKEQLKNILNRIQSQLSTIQDSTGTTMEKETPQIGESDISGLLAASKLNREFIVTAKTYEGETKRFRVRAQSERTAKEKFQRHYSQAEILSVKEEGVAEGFSPEDERTDGHYDDPSDGIYMGAKVYHREHQAGIPFKVIKIIDDQRVGVIDDYGNKKVMFINQLVPAQQGVAEAFQNDEANLYYKYDTADGRLKQRMVNNNDERQAFAQGYKGTPEQALKAAGIIRSKFDPNKFVQNQGGKWVQVYPYGKQGVAEGSIRDKIKGAAKSVKRATQGWGVGAAPDMITPKGVVQAFGDMDGQRLANFVASRKDFSKPGKDSARAFADKVIDREMKQRGYGRVADKDEQGVAEGSNYSATDDTVSFTLETERAYEAVMSRFGDIIDFDETAGTMTVPERIWPKVEVVAFDADGIGAQRNDELENPEHYGIGEGTEGYTVGIEAYGVKGMKSTPWRRTFPTQAAFERWMEKADGDYELHGAREVEIPVKQRYSPMREGYTVTRGIDRERYQERDGLEGPFSTRSGKVVYYDSKEGKYYDPDTDMYIEYDDWKAMNESDSYDDEDDNESQDQFYIALYDEDENTTFVGLLYKDNKWREQAVAGSQPYNWGTQYMSYLSPNEVMQWIEKDYGRGYEVAGPFSTKEEAMEYAEYNFGPMESVTEAKHGLNKRVRIVSGPADAIGKIGTVGEVRRGLHKDAPKTYTVDYENDTGRITSIQLQAKDLKLVKESATETKMKNKKVAEAKNHMDETEYTTYAAWKRACKAAGADSFEGDKDICQAMKGKKGVGEWDGATGSVYGDAHKAKKVSEATKEIKGGRVHTAEPGGYGRQADDEELSTADRMRLAAKKRAEKAAQPKRGRGRPKADTKVDSSTAAKELQRWIVGSVPKSKALEKLPKTAHKISSPADKDEEESEQINELDKATVQRYANASKRDYNRINAFARDEGSGSYRERKASAGKPRDNSDHWTTKIQDKRVSGLKRAKDRGVTPSKPGAGKYVSVGDQMRSDSRGTMGTWMGENDVGEGNEFTGALAAAKASGKKEFTVGGKKHTVKESAAHISQLKARISETIRAVQKLPLAQQNDPRVTALVSKLEESVSTAVGGMLRESRETLEHIVQRFPAEVKGFARGGEMSEDLYHALYDYYLLSGQMPYGVAKARDVDPMEWVEGQFDADLEMGIGDGDYDEYDDELDEAAGTKEGMSDSEFWRQAKDMLTIEGFTEQRKLPSEGDEVSYSFSQPGQPREAYDISLGSDGVVNFLLLASGMSGNDSKEDFLWTLEQDLGDYSRDQQTQDDDEYDDELDEGEHTQHYTPKPEPKGILGRAGALAKKAFDRLAPGDEELLAQLQQRAGVKPKAVESVKQTAQASDLTESAKTDLTRLVNLSGFKK